MRVAVRWKHQNKPACPKIVRVFKTSQDHEDDDDDDDDVHFYSA